MAGGGLGAPPGPVAPRYPHPWAPGLRVCPHPLGLQPCHNTGPFEFEGCIRSETTLLKEDFLSVAGWGWGVELLNWL